jgi:hypothetical protein
MVDKLKKYETIAACGIDCGLCPRFYTKGNSACPGCGGLNFKEKHPSCGVLTCCVIKNGFETCAECKEFPCSRFKTEGAGCDSFTTHKKMLSNLNEIKTIGIEQFVEKQKTRIDILSNLLTNYDDGRAKSFFCQTCALFSIDKLQELSNEVKTTDANVELKEKSKIVRKLIMKTADTLGVDLKLNKKTKQ